MNTENVGQILCWAPTNLVYASRSFNLCAGQGPTLWIALLLLSPSLLLFVVSSLGRGLDERNQIEREPRWNKPKRVDSVTVEKERGCNPEILSNPNPERSC